MNAMNTNPSISVEVLPGGMDKDGHETFEVKFVGDPVGDEPVPSVVAHARTVWFGERVVFVVVTDADFENVPNENKIELLLMVPKAITRLRHIRAEVIPVFDEDLAEEVPYLNQVSVSVESIEGTRMALANYVEEADQNLVRKGYFFHPAEVPPPPPVTEAPLVPPRPDINVNEGTVAPGFEKTPVDIAGGSNEVPETPPPGSPVTPAVPLAEGETGVATAGVLSGLPMHSDGGSSESAVAAEEAQPAKKLKIGYDEAQLMLVGANAAALGEGVTVDFRTKVNGEKFEVIAIESIQTVGIDIDTALGLAFGALGLIKRSSELPLEMGMTKPGCEALCAQVEDLEENSKLNSHLGLHLIDAEYVATKVAAAAEAGYVAALEE